jgi:hypothetical protein
MMSNVFQFFKSLGIFLFFYGNIKKQKRFYARHLYSDIEKLMVDIQLERKDKLLKKCSLYSVAVPARLGEVYCVLRGRKMSIEERLALTCMGGLTGLFDDLFDENKLSDNEITQFVESKQIIKDELSELRIILFLFSLLEKNIPDQNELGVMIKRILSSQIESRRQKSENLSLQELENITSEKGGATMLMYRLAFRNELKEDEKEMIFQLGAIGQIVNDIFDVYKDVTDQIKTVANQSQDISVLKNEFEFKLKELIKTVRNNSFPDKNTNKFFHFLILIVSGAYLCMENYIRLQNQTSNVFRPEMYGRKNLICDMEKAGNVFRLIQISVMLNKELLINDTISC